MHNFDNRFGMALAFAAFQFALLMTLDFRRWAQILQLDNLLCVVCKAQCYLTHAPIQIGGVFHGVLDSMIAISLKCSQEHPVHKTCLPSLHDKNTALIAMQYGAAAIANTHLACCLQDTFTPDDNFTFRVLKYECTKSGLPMPPILGALAMPPPEPSSSPGAPVTGISFLPPLTTHITHATIKLPTSDTRLLHSTSPSLLQPVFNADPIMGTTNSSALGTPPHPPTSFPGTTVKGSLDSPPSPAHIPHSTTNLPISDSCPSPYLVEGGVGGVTLQTIHNTQATTQTPGNTPTNTEGKETSTRHP